MAMGDIMRLPRRFISDRTTRKYAIHVAKNGERIGPFTKKELREAIHSGKVSWDDLAWHKELSEWKAVNAVIPIIHVARGGEELGTFENERGTNPLINYFLNS